MTEQTTVLSSSRLGPSQGDDVEQRLRALSARTKTATLDVVWRQWRALGASVTAEDAPLGALIDPEALVLASIGLIEIERRLVDVLGWWAEVGAPLLSVQRLRNLAPHFAPDSTRSIAPFAALAVAGGDRRWLSLAAGDPTPAAEDWRPRSGKGSTRVRLHEPTALLLRLRAGCGVGVKSDLVALLLGRGGDWVTVREATEALGYTDAAVRHAAREMGLADFIETAASGPIRYRGNWGRWAPLVSDGSGGPPIWRHGSQVFALMSAVWSWADQSTAPGATPSLYLASTAARDLVEAHRGAWELNGLRAPDGTLHRGGDYLEAFERAVEQLSEWVQGNA